MTAKPDRLTKPAREALADSKAQRVIEQAIRGMDEASAVYRDILKRRVEAKPIERVLGSSEDPMPIAQRRAGDLIVDRCLDLANLSIAHNLRNPQAWTERWIHALEVAVADKYGTGAVGFDLGNTLREGIALGLDQSRARIANPAPTSPAPIVAAEARVPSREWKRYHSEWKNVLREALVNLGRVPAQDVANWIAENAPHTPSPAYFKGYKEKDAGLAVKNDKRIREQFQKDLNKVKLDLWGKAKPRDRNVSRS